jgi:putative glycosyltransferase (TIGR04372 family)
VPASLILVVLRLLRPVINVELLIVAYHRFGHLALEPEAMLCRTERDAKNSPHAKVFPKTIRLWSLGPRRLQANRFLAKKWNEVIASPPSWTIDALVKAGERFPSIKLASPKLSIQRQDNSLDGSLPHLIFSDSEIREAESALETIGIDPNRKFVCLVVRDGGHYKLLGEAENPNTEVFNFDIADFEMAAESLATRGYQVVRMGAGTEKPMTTRIDGVFDYALSQHRSELLDIYIAANCEFAISTQTGPDCVCLAFRRPVCYVDVTRFSQFFFGTKIAYWSPSKISLNGRLLTLKEIAASDLAWIKDPDDFERVGLDGVHSTVEEILGLANGFTDLYEGGLVMTADDLAMSVKAQEIISDGFGQRGKDAFGRITAQINPAFLREHGEWFLS